MSGYVRAVNFVKNLIKGKKTSPTIKSVAPNVGNLKFNQETMNKLNTITDRYVAGPGQVHADLKKTFRDTGSKSLQKTEKILRKKKKYGGRMGLKFGGGADKQLSSKQMKIASLAGNKKKIDKLDFKKLREMKSPISKSVRKA